MKNETYKNKKPVSDGACGLELLPEGDYTFEVARCGDPYKNSKGNWILPLRLSVLPAATTTHPPSPPSGQ